MNLPTQEQCLKYFEEYAVPENIKEHCVAVQKYGVFLAQELNKVGYNLDLELLKRILVLHDLFKVVVIEKLEENDQHHPEPYTEKEISMWKFLREKYSGMYEGDVAYEIFKDDFPELALSIKRASNPRTSDKTREELFAHFVDWCVLNDRWVSLQRRVEYLRKTYPLDEDYWAASISEVENFEKEIFTKLSFTPEDVAKLAEDFEVIQKE